MQKWKGKAGPFYHVSDVNIYLGRQRGEGPLTKRTRWKPFLAASVQTLEFQTSVKRNLPLVVCDEKHVREMHHSHDKTDQAFSLYFCILQVPKNWMVGTPGNEAKDHICTLKWQHIHTSPLSISLIWQLILLYFWYILKVSLLSAGIMVNHLQWNRWMLV